MSILNRIIKTLDSKGFKTVDLARVLDINSSVISTWKKRNTNPPLEYFGRICEFLGVTPEYLLFGQEKDSSLKSDELALLNLYNELPRESKEALAYRASELYVLSEYNNRVDEVFNNNYHDKLEPGKTNIVDLDTKRLREIPVYFESVSAGTGNFLNHDNYELVDFSADELPLQTTFGVVVSGDSMEPSYSTGDTLFVKQQPTIENGELGIFIYNGDALFKQYIAKDDNKYLKSINLKYDPIKIKEDDSLFTFGKVIGCSSKK